MKLKFEYQNQLTQELTVSLAKTAELPAEAIVWEHPAVEGRGDWATNVALKLKSQISNLKTKSQNLNLSEETGERQSFLENIFWLLKNVTKNNFETFIGALPVGRLQPAVQKLLKSQTDLVFLKPRVYAKIRGWWQKLSGHPELAPIFAYLPLICYSPLAIYQDKSRLNGFLFTFQISHFGILAIEILPEKNEIVTAFFTRAKRMKFFKRLWLSEKSSLGRRRFSSLLASRQGGIAGAGLSSLQESQAFYNTLPQESQAAMLWYQPTPFQTAQKLVLAWQAAGLPEFVAKVEVAGPGFINVWLKQDYLITQLSQVLESKEKFGASTFLNGKTVVIDYSAPNIAKPFGIGHLRSTNIGQALYNLFSFSGAKVVGDNHLGDWGTQFGKIIYQVVNKIGKDKLNRLTIADLEKTYVDFHQEAETKPELNDEAKKWFKRLEEGDKEAREIWQACVDLSLQEFQRIYDLLQVKIDHVYGESFYEDKMAEIIAEAKKLGLARESQGALIIDLPGEKTPLMLLKDDGATTYATRDLATIKFRLKKWQPDLFVYEVGAEQSFYFRQLFAAAELLGYAPKDHFVHIGHGLIRGKTGKFSTREGKTIHLEEVLLGAINQARQLCDQAGISKDLPSGEKDKVAQTVGIGAVKYNDLKQDPQMDIIFDWRQMLNLEGNSGPYLQYTYARTQSVLGKLKTQNSKLKTKSQNEKPEKILDSSFGFDLCALTFEINSEELSLLRAIYRFPEAVLEATQNYAPNLICNYLYDLAQKFNFFYHKHRILESDQQDFRLVLTMATGQVLKNGLTLLGIAAPERM